MHMFLQPNTDICKSFLSANLCLNFEHDFQHVCHLIGKTLIRNFLLAACHPVYGWLGKHLGRGRVVELSTGIVAGQWFWGWSAGGLCGSHRGRSGRALALEGGPSLTVITLITGVAWPLLLMWRTVCPSWDLPWAPGMRSVVVGCRVGDVLGGAVGVFPEAGVGRCPWSLVLGVAAPRMASRAHPSHLVTVVTPLVCWQVPHPVVELALLERHSAERMPAHRRCGVDKWRSKQMSEVKAEWLQPKTLVFLSISGQGLRQKRVISAS